MHDMINVNTPVTTPAHRVARAASVGKPGLEYLFDADGQVVDARHSDERWVNRRGRNSRVVAAALGGPMAARDAQDLIDANDYALMQTDLSYALAHTFYLQQVAAQRGNR